MELEKAAPKKAAFSYGQDDQYSAAAWMHLSAYGQDDRYNAVAWMRRSVWDTANPVDTKQHPDINLLHVRPV